MASILASSVLCFTSRLMAAIGRSSSASSSSSSCDNIDGELKKLKRTLLRIQAVLNDAEEREVRDESVKLWLKELKDVAYDAVDVLDEYEYDLLRSKVESEEAFTETTTSKRKHEEEVSHSTTSLAMDGITHRIKEIRERFDEIVKDRDALHLREGDGERLFENTMTRPPTSSHVDESGVYGREVIKSKLIELLLSDDNYGGENFSVVPIVGMGGIGKTTLAQLVYNDPSICQYFDLKAWVCASEDFDGIRLTKAIIQSITRSSYTLTELSTLQDTLKEKLQGKKVLVVLDDVWNEKQSYWESLRAPFIGAGVVKIIITTRNESVAKLMRTISHIRLDCLPEDQCWLLFQQCAFDGQYNNAHTYLVDIGKKIVKKCGGLPLAVKALGGVLRNETNEERWTDILESNIWELGESKDEIMPALRLSYQRMPTCLKPCFVYCSLFSKDYRFHKDTLVKLWMAQGFIQRRGSKTIEDIGNEYFYELLNRSFFQYSHTVDDRGDDENEMFVMHDLIHDLAQFISEKEFFRVESEKVFEDIPAEARHLSIGPPKGQSFQSFNKCRALHTFMCYGSSKYTKEAIHVKMLEDMFLNLGCLRTLDISDIDIGDVPDSINNLKHLRYLCLRSCTIKRLPESLCHLYNLQALVLAYFSPVALPRGIENLINLRHLEVPYFANMPPGIGKLTNLQTLKTSCWGIGNMHCGLSEMRELMNLRELAIYLLSTEVNVKDAEAANLKDKRYLQRLSLSWDGVPCDGWGKRIFTWEELEEGVLLTLQPHMSLKKLEIHGYDGGRFPNWVGDPSFCNLVYVSLNLCVSCKFLPPLGLLPSLRDLHIGYMGIRSVGREFCYLGEDAVIKVFPSLEKLRFYDMLYWKEWCGILDGEFPRLRVLRLSDCDNLKTVVGLQYLTSLQELKIHRCRKLRLPPNVRLQCMPQHIDIQNCPGLEKWCQRHEIQYYQTLHSDSDYESE